MDKNNLIFAIYFENIVWYILSGLRDDIQLRYITQPFCYFQEGFLCTELTLFQKEGDQKAWRKTTK